MKGYVFQTEEFVDNVWTHDNGTVTSGTKLPYPYRANSKGDVMGQEFWSGDPVQILGFQDDIDVQKVDLWWDDFVKDPDRALGLHIVGLAKDGNVSTYGKTPIRDIHIFEVPERV